MRPEILAPASRARILDGVVKDEVTGGARVEHRDSVTAVLARGRERLLVTVDEAGIVHVDRIAERRRIRKALVALGVLVVGLVVAVVVLLAQPGVRP